MAIGNIPSGVPPKLIESPIDNVKPQVAKPPSSSAQLDTLGKSGATQAPSQPAVAPASPEKTSETIHLAVPHAPPNLDNSMTLDISTLSTGTPKPLDHRWDLANPKNNLTLLTRFAANRKEQLKKESGALPKIEFWESLADKTFSRAHTTITAMQAASETPDAMSLEKACTNLFIYDHDCLELDGLTITDPGVLQAIRMIRVARNPLSMRDGIVADKAFRNHQPSYNKSDIQTILACDHEYRRANISDTITYFDMVSRNLPGFAQGLETAVRNKTLSTNIIAKGEDGRTWEILNEPLDRSLQLLAAKDDPSELESYDDQVLLERFIEQRGGVENIHFDRETIVALVNEQLAAQDVEHQSATDMLESIQDDPKAIAIMARSVLLTDENRGQLGRTTGVMDLRFTMNENMRSALRIIAHETDKPSTEIAGTDLDVANWHFNNTNHQPEYTLECLRGIVDAMQEFDTEQSQHKVARLARSYNFKVDKKQKIRANIQGLETQFSESIEQYSKVETAMEAIAQYINNPGKGDTTTTMLKRIRRTIDEKMSPAIKDEDGKEFLEFFTTSLDAAIYRNMKESLTNELCTQLAYLEKGGASESVSFKVGAGWGIGPAANMNAGIEVKMAVTGNDDRRVREGKSFTVSVGAKGSVGIASLMAKLGFGGKKGKTFKSVDDFVKYHRDDVLMMVLQNSESGSEHGDLKTFKRAEKLNKMTKQQMDVFDRSAQFLGVIAANEGIVVDPNNKPVPTETTTFNASQTIGATFGEGVGEVSAKLSANEGITVFHKRVDLLDFLKENLDTLDTVTDNTPKQTSIPAYPGYETMEAFEKRLTTIDSPQAKAQAIVDAMETVHIEFTRYTQLIRQYDGLKGPFSWLHKSPMERQLHDIKHSFQNSRGSGDRGSFLQATITTHAHLLHTLRQTCSEQQLEGLDLTTMEETYRYPRVVLKDKHVKKLHQRVTKTGKAAEVAFDVSVAGPVGTNLTAGAKVQKVTNNSNPDNDGTYLNLKLEGSIDYAKVLPAIIDGISELPALNPADPSKVFEAISLVIGKAVKTVEPAASTVLDLGLDSKIPNSATVELNFINSFSMALQYARVTATGGPSLEVEDIPVGGGMNLSAGVGKTWSRQVTERLGTNTFSYVLTQFNGFKLAGGHWEPKWNTWTDNNKNQIWSLAKNIGKEDTNANKEIRIMAELDDTEMQSYTKLKATTQAITKQEAFDATLYAEFKANLQDFILSTQGKGSLSLSALQDKGWKPRVD